MWPFGKIYSSFAQLYLLVKAKKPFQRPRDLWWFPMVLCTIGALCCFNQLSLASPSAMNWITVGLASPIVPWEISMLFFYDTIQGYKIMNMEIGVGFRSLLNCGLFVASVGISALKEKSWASILVFDFSAAAIIAGERLVESKTDFGLFLFFCGCSITQANMCFGFGVRFWLFAGIAWFLQATRGYLLNFYPALVPTPSLDATE